MATASGSSSRSVLSANGLVIAALVIGFANNVAIAALFGLTRRVDAYYAALMLPMLFMHLFVDYLGKNFLPAFARARKQDEEIASQLMTSVVTIVGSVAVAVAATLALFGGPLFVLLLPGFAEEDIALVHRYFVIMAPTLVLSAVTVFHEYACQHDESYFRIAAIRSVLPLANLVAILGLSPLIDEYALPAGYLLGHVVVSLLMARSARYTFTWRITFRREFEGRIFSNSAIVMGSGLVARTRMIIMNYLGSMLGGGAIAALALSNRLTDPVSRSAFTAVRMLMFSRTARMSVEGDARGIARLYETGLAASFLLLTPLVFWVAVNSGAIVEVVFMRGEFDRQMATLVSLALIGAAPSIVFIGVNSLMSNGFYALNRIAVPALVMPIGTLLYAAAAPFLSARYGVLGLTVASSAAIGVVFVIMLVLLSRQIEDFDGTRTAARIGRYVLLAGAAFGLPAVMLDSLGMSETVSAAVSLAAGGSLYLVALLALRDPILTFVYQYVRKAGPGGGRQPVRSTAG